MRRRLAAVLISIGLLCSGLTGCMEPQPTYQINCGAPGQPGDINVLGQQKQAP